MMDKIQLQEKQSQQSSTTNQTLAYASGKDAIDIMNKQAKVDGRREKNNNISDFHHLEGEEEKKEHNHDTNEDVHMNDSIHSIKFS